MVAKQFTQWRYVQLRIDFRGCGEAVLLLVVDFHSNCLASS